MCVLVHVCVCYLTIKLIDLRGLYNRMLGTEAGNSRKKGQMSGKLINGYYKYCFGEVGPVAWHKVENKIKEKINLLSLHGTLTDNFIY